MMKRQNLSILLVGTVFLLVATICQGQERGIITGLVIDATTGETLAGASVIIQDSKLGAYSDKSGKFTIQAVPVGTYRLRADMIGYESQLKNEVRVQNGQKTHISFALKQMPIKIKEITITATRLPSDITKVTPFVSTISQEELRTSSAVNLAQLLTKLTSLNVTSYGGPGKLSTASIRGSSYQQVLVLIDGQRVNNAQNGGVNFDDFSKDAIEKVEVVRGGYSAIYGADAIGGVINIVTKQPESTFLRGWSKTGSYGFLSGGAEGGLNIDKVSAFFSLSNGKSKDNFAFKDSFGQTKIRVNSAFQRNDLFAKVQWQASKDMKLRISGQRYSSDNGDPGPIGQYTPNSNIKDNLFVVRTDMEKRVSDRFQYRLNLYGQRSEQHYYNPDGFVPVDAIHRVASGGVELRGDLRYWKSSSFLWGASYGFDRLNSTVLSERNRGIGSFFLQGELVCRGSGNLPIIESITLFPALRFDRYSDFGGALSPRIGTSLVLQDIESISFKANLARSYRAPTLNDLYWPEDNYSLGNPNLRPERGVSFDIGLSYSQNNWMNALGSMAYFHNRLKDEIAWYPGRNGKWSPINLSESETKGLETELNLSTLSGLLNLKANYTFLKAQDNLKRQLMYRPLHSLNYTLWTEKGPARLSFEGKHVSRRFYTRENTAWLDGYALYNVCLSLSREIARSKAQIALSIENLADIRYQLMKDYPLPGRQWNLKLDFEL